MAVWPPAFSVPLHDRFSGDRGTTVRHILTRARSRCVIRDDVSNTDVVDLIAGSIFYWRRRRPPFQPTPERQPVDDHREPTRNPRSRIFGLENR